MLDQEDISQKNYEIVDKRICLFKFVIIV